MGWSWSGAVALVLAAAVGIGWAVALVVAVVNADWSGPGAVLLYVLGGTLVGGLIAWLPGRRGARDD